MERADVDQDEVDDEDLENGKRKGKTFVVEERTRIGRLKNFSGRKPLPNNEVDYSTWRLLVLQHLNDPSVRKQELKAAMIQSLSGQALDMMQPHIINPRATPDVMFGFLEDVFGDRKDGRELLINFYGELQSRTQPASEYLQSLYVKLTEVTYRDGINPIDFDLHIRDQFSRGCHDDTLLQKLMADPNYGKYRFTDLVGKVRMEEIRMADRHKRFASVTSSSAQNVPNQRTSSARTMLQSQVRPNQSYGQVGNSGNAQVANSQQQNVNSSVNRSNGVNRPNSEDRQGFTPRRFRRRKFCYRCGEDDHIANGCQNQHNPQLVQDKLLWNNEARRQHRPN
jgi:hypothetical protein